MLSWKLYRCLENSLKDFLTSQGTTDSVTDINGNLIPIYIGRREDKNWTLPCISLYVDSETATRIEIGSNARDDRQLMIIDIYATDEGERLDLAKWITDTINNGFRYYTYTVNPSNPESPVKVAGGLTHVDFLTNGRVNLGQNVSEIDSHRHKITINVFLTGV
jgi:hypothetical protein